MATTARAPLPVGVRGVVLLCGVVLLLDTTFFAVLSPLLAGYAASAHLDQAAVGLLVAAYPLGAVLGAIPAGNLVSRLGPRAVLVTGMLTIAATTVLFALAATGPQLIGYRFVQGVGGVLAWTAAMTWVSTVAPVDRRGELVGRVLGMAVIGSAIGPVIGALATLLGTTPVFVGLGLVFVVLSGMARRFPAPPVSPSPGWRHALRLLGDHRLRLGMWLLALGGIGAGAINTLAPITLAEVGVTAVGTSAVFLVMAVAAALTSPRVGRSADRRGRPVVAIAILVVATAALLATGLVSRAGGPLPLLVALLIVSFTVLEAGYVPGSAFLADGTADAHASRGEVLALANLAWASAMALASVLAGVLASRWGEVAPYAAVAVCTAATLPEFVMMARRAHRR
jgi:MFS family permease